MLVSIGDVLASTYDEAYWDGFCGGQGLFLSHAVVINCNCHKF